MCHCPNCNQIINKHFKFCPYCSINIDHYNNDNLNCDDDKRSKFCYNCGTKVESNYNYCIECGKPINKSASDNKIDKSINIAKNSLSNFSQEINESKTISEFTKNVKVKTKYIGSEILKYIGGLCYLSIIAVMIYPFITGNEFLIKSIYDRNGKDILITLIAILVPIIIPLLFTYISFRKNEKLFVLFWVTLGFLILETFVSFTPN